MRRALDFLYDASLVLAGGFLVGIFLLMLGESAFRSLGSYITGANELVGWFCAAAGFLALPAMFKRGDMVRVAFGVDALPPGSRKAALVSCLLVGLVFVSYMVWAVARYLLAGLRSEETTQGMLVLPVWIPQLSFLVGSALLWVAFVDELLGVLRTPKEALRAEPEQGELDATAL